MRIRSLSPMLLLIAALSGAALPVRAQTSTDTTIVVAKRTMVTRAELQTALDEIERGVASTGYSAAIRTSKQADAQVIKDRLNDGDLRPADQVNIQILSEPGLSGMYTVSPARTIILPGNAEIPVRGVLRSEAQDYLTKQFKRFINEPSLTVTTYVRVQLSGAVGKQGFFNAPASMLLSDELMKDGGGPAGNVVWKKSTIKRGDRLIVDGPDFDLAVRNGVSLDQLNVQAGDEVNVYAKPSSALFWRIVAGFSALAGVAYLIHTFI